MLEEAGVARADIVRVIGVYSRPDRDPRFHAVTVVVECAIDAPTKPPVNPLEIRDVRLFEAAELPSDLAMGMADMMRDALRNEAARVE
jgi:8-oxo-dGTP diphosphatase